MFTSRSSFRLIVLWFVFAAAARLCGQVNLQLIWGSSLFTDPTQQRVPSGQSYSPTAVAHGGTFNSSTVMTATVTKSGGTGYSSSVSTPPGMSQGVSAGTAATTDTGNHWVNFTATGSNSSSGEHLTLSQAIKIYIPDSIPPSTPAGLSVTGLGANQFTLVWNASTDSDNPTGPGLVDYYEVAANGSVIATIPAGSAPFPGSYSYTYSGLTPGTNYSMTVRARDWAGNYSAAWSSPFGITTLVPDTTPPSQPGAIVFSNVGLYSANAQWGSSTDNSGAVASYSVNLLQGGVNGAVLATYVTASTNLAIATPALAANTTYGVSVVARDAAGNVSPASVGSFTTQVAYAPGPVVLVKVTDTTLAINWGSYVVAPATDHYSVEINGASTPAGVGDWAWAQIGYNFTGLSPNTQYTLRVQAVGTTGAVSNWSDPLIVTTETTLANLPTVARPTGSGNLVASTGGSLSVDNHGSANYSIPLQIAPGRGGLQPSVSLSYSSGAGNGVAGVGFSASTGFAQSITRGRSILARDGETRGVEFSANDKFYLDGKRLICVSGTYGQANSVYRTEVDSFVTITAFGSGASIDRFDLVDKSGTTSSFGKLGGTTDAFQKGGGELTGMAYTYALKQVTDSLGNYVAFTYTALGGGEYVLGQMDYTGGTSVAPAAQVVFSYETTRPDQPTTYLANRTFNHRARLAVVTAKSGGITTAAYGLNYDNDVNGGRSRLTSVAPVLADPQSQALQTCPPLVISWLNNSSGMATTGPSVQLSSPPSYDIQWGDTNNDGVDEPMLGSDGVSYCTKYGDFDGDGKKDKLALYFSGGSLSGMTVSLASNAPITFSAAGLAKLSSYFVDPNSQNGSHLLAAAEGMGLASRITVADFDGDGRDDILVHGFDGTIHVYRSNGNTFADPIDDAAHSPFVGGAGDVTWESGWVNQTTMKTWIDNHYYVKPIPCDLNGDGRTDYVCISYTRLMKYPASPYVTLPSGFMTIRHMIGVLSLPDGNGGIKFSQPFAIGGPAMGVPTETNEPWGNNTGAIGNIRLNDVNCGAMPGDFNGDGLTDFLILVPDFEMQPGLNTGSNSYYQGKRWALYLNQGVGPNGTPVFAECKGPIPNTVTLPSGQSVNTYYTPSKSTGALGYLNGPIQYLTTPSPQGKDFLAGFEGAAGTTNNYIMDINHDGLADLVWYVAVDTSENPVTGQAGQAAGWYAMLSTGNFSSGSPGFVGPVRVDFLNGVSGGLMNTTGGSVGSFSGSQINNSFDFNGDGHPDFFIQGTQNGRPSTLGSVYLATAADHVAAASFNDLVSSITDGLGRVTTVAYKAAKDPAVYTKGAAVTFPIRDLWASTPVVSDVWQDSGATGQPAQFSYQYSGNRLDLSGRGSLGFHSFVTLDRQTNLFKYQFLAQSFPMTGLTHREETYRWLAANSFNIISSHDNTVVFDKVSTGGGATLWPFISKAIESRWEDGTGQLTTSGSNLSSDPENLFPLAKPAGAHITIVAQSTFDGQSSPQLTLPGVSGYSPSDATGSQNTVTGTTSFATFSGLPGAITYGNLTNLATDYGNGYSEAVTTTYIPAAGPLTGLVGTVTTSATGGGYTDSSPTKTYTYFGNTPLVWTEKVAGGGDLTTTTTYGRDSLGRVIATTISGNNLQSVGQGGANYLASQAIAFDGQWDLPTQTLDAYGHPTTVTYHPFLAKPTSIIDANGAQVTTVYDALGRATSVTDVLKGLTSNTSFSWDTSQPVSVPSGVTGVALTSVYSVTTTATVAPSVTAYYDRLGRVIRTIKNGFNGQQTVTDAVYNVLGQTVATSLPYLSGTTALWTRTTYDPLGRVVTVTAPNGTVTTNTYKGRATSVNVTPVVGTAQTNTTVVDAKGRTVSVWNADNVPSFSDTLGSTGTAPSINFALDGFGRIRTTTLLGQSQTITATYDALGRQTQLADPDKGTWNYTNSALGQVLTQTDAKANVTNSSFDRLGRPLSRLTSGSGSTETANFYYYDSMAGVLGDPTTHTVPLGTQGWIGAPEREECNATGSYATTNLHYYDAKGRPAIELAQSDGKWFYTYSDYDVYSRVHQVRHYWKPSGAEAPATQPYLWQDFGYVYNYDAKSYLLSLTDSLGRSWWDNPVYDYMDRVTSVRKGAGLTTTRTYRDTDGVLTGLTTGGVQNMSFGFDGLGNLTSRADTGVSETYGYDNLNRLKQRNGGDIAGYEPNGNIDYKTEVGGSTVTINAYDSAHPHAVSSYTFSGQPTTITYDANGNLNTRSGGGSTWSMQWAGFDKPRWMAKTAGGATVGSEFHYNAARSRVMQLEFDSMSGGAPLHYNRKRVYALGSTLELNYTNFITSGAGQSWTLGKVRIYVPGPDGIIGAREFDPGAVAGSGTEKALVYHYDHLGSITAITNYGTGTLASDSNNAAGKFSEDAWGQRRNPATWSGAPNPALTDDGHFDSLTPRGYTGHEMLDDLGLVHMNGRIYDPLLGRFLSADLVVQAPGSLQSYNRYSYVNNNPLTLTDPTGFYSILGLEFTDGGGVSGFVQDLASYQTAAASGAASGAGNYTVGLVQGSAAAVSGTANAIAHPIDAVQGATNGLGTLAGRAVFDTAALGGDIKNAAVATVSDPNKLGQAVGNFVTGTAIGVGAAKGLSAAGELAGVAAKTERVAATGTAEGRLAVAPEAKLTSEIKSGTSVVEEAKGVTAPEGKTHQTYTKTNPETGEVYSGRTSGKGTPAENVAARDADHHMTEKGFGPAQLDKSSSNAAAIRGREQQLIEANGGAKSTGGTSGNSINGVSAKNPKRAHYNNEANKEFSD